MGHRFADIAFTPAVKDVQRALGSRAGYAKLEAGPAHHDRLSAREAEFIAARDSFYMATVSETGWPYVQHRGGPAGFVRALDERTIGFADLRGNRQYVSVGNLSKDDRASMIMVDYPRRARLKLLGRARFVAPDGDPAVTARLAPEGEREGAQVERYVLIDVEAFDWNCPQHITERYTLAEIEALSAPLRARVAELEAQVAELTRAPGTRAAI